MNRLSPITMANCAMITTKNIIVGSSKPVALSRIEIKAVMPKPIVIQP